MVKYVVKVAKTITYVGTVIVSAADDDEACEKGQCIAEEGSKKVDWELDEETFDIIESYPEEE